MRALPKVATLMVVFSCIAGCMSAHRAPVKPPGAIVEAYRAPLQTDFVGQDLGSKHGEAKTRYFRDPIFTGLPIAAWGDAAVKAAAEEGGITEVKHLDYEVLNILGVYVEFTVHAYGD